MDNREHGKSAVTVEHLLLTQVRHPLRAAQLLYSAPAAVLRGPIYLVAFIVGVSLLYSIWATKDELVIAPLTLERESLIVEAIEGGMISRVPVRDGDRVESGALLVEAKRTRVTAISEGETLRAQAREVEEKLDILATEHHHTVRQLQLALNNIAKDRTLLEQQLADAQAQVAFLNGKLAKARQDLKADQRLFDGKDITKAEYDRTKARVDDLEKGVGDADSHATQVGVTLAGLRPEKIQNELDQAEERYQTQKQRLDRNLATVREQIEREETLLRGIDQEGSIIHYKSTFPGLVSQVHVKPGNLIAPGAAMVTLVKESSALEGVVLVPNKDIGRLKRGQTVQIKYYAYPYQEYGIPVGVIASIATKPRAQPGQESRYAVRIALASESISRRGDKAKQLDLGLEGIAEIKTGEKRFIELLFSPLSRFFTQEE